MKTLLCIYTILTPVKNDFYRYTPMIKGIVIKESNSHYLVDFSNDLDKLKANKLWNTRVKWVKENNCINLH